MIITRWRAIILICPALFPLYLYVREKTNGKHLVFLLLLLSQWLILLTSNKNIFLGFASANMSILFLLIFNPYYALNVESAFEHDSLWLIKNPLIKISSIALVLMITTPLAELMASFMYFWFIEPFYGTPDRYVIVDLTRWTMAHKVSLWVTLMGFVLLQLNYNVSFGSFWRDDRESQDKIAYPYLTIFAGYMAGIIILSRFFNTVNPIRVNYF